MAFTRLYRDGVLAAEGFPVDQVSELVAEPGALIWVDVQDDQAALDVMRSELGLDPLAVEDAGERRQRPKLDRYPGHVYLNAYLARMDTHTGALQLVEVGAFATRQVLITVCSDGLLDTAELTRRWDAHPDLLKHGTTALVYGLLDLIVDSHFDAVETLDEAIERVEDVLFTEHRTGPDIRHLQRLSFEIRKSLVRLRRIVLPMREVLNTIMRRDTELSEEVLLPYYQDVYDHVLRVSEWTESLRDMVTTIFETNLSMQDHTLNTIMKKLSGWAAIIAVPTAVTGFYGQNVPYPGFAQHSGFLVSTMLWMGISGLLFLVFRRRDWI